MKVNITRIDKDLPLPKYETGGAVGCDLYARVTTVVPAKSLGKIPANVIIETPKGYMFMVASRGSTPFKKGLLPPHGFGVGDQDFCGPEDEYWINVYNFTDEDVTVERGERVAQGIFVPVEVAQWEEIEKADKPSRGGDGSTGGHINRSVDKDDQT
jgi:dUTP pyrophosphatase